MHKKDSVWQSNSSSESPGHLWVIYTLKWKSWLDLFSFFFLPPYVVTSPMWSVLWSLTRRSWQLWLSRKASVEAGWTFVTILQWKQKYCERLKKWQTRVSTTAHPAGHGGLSSKNCQLPSLTAPPSSVSLYLPKLNTWIEAKTTWNCCILSQEFT